MWALMEVTVEAKLEHDRDRLLEALEALAAEDRAFEIHLDAESGRTIMGGVGESHLDDKADRLLHGYDLDVVFGQPQVAYRETIGHRARIDHVYRRHMGPMSQFAGVGIVFAPVHRGVDYAFETELAAGSPAREFVPGVERGLLKAREKGLMTGFPVIGLTATLVDCKFDEIDSSPVAFEIAAGAAFRELREKASPRLVEPVMTVEVTASEDSIDGLVGDLHQRRGAILDVHRRGDASAIVAHVPLANLFGYANVLRSLGEGRGQFAMSYAHYDVVPQPEPPDDLFPPAIGMRA